ncbi:MAG TPA: chemotaxis protein CheW, partial [Candidatus Nitrosotenuis sp.]|nr:chemotaxis protein CheW [Candidatus Nitrosotenuis sp.]
MSAQIASFDSFQAVTFCLTDGQKKEEYAIPIEQVREIRAVESITKIPKAKSYVKGIMNLRGLIIPVIDVKEKLGLGSEGTNSSKQRILVADVNGSL